MGKRIIRKSSKQIEKSGAPLFSHTVQYLRGMRQVASDFSILLQKYLAPAVREMDRAEKRFEKNRNLIRGKLQDVRRGSPFEKRLKEELEEVGADIAKKEAAGQSVAELRRLENWLKQDVENILDGQEGLLKAMGDIDTALAKDVPSDAARGLALSSYVFEKANNAQYRQFVSGMNKIVAIPIQDVLAKETPTTRRLFRARVRESQKLITSLKPEGQKRLRKITRELIAGQRVDIRRQIAGSIQAEALRTWETIDNRAQLIAIDQMHSYTADLQIERSTAIGITHYIWRDSGDSRVRTQDRKQDGKKYAYDKPPPGGHPGQKIRCRCTAEPDLSTLLGRKEV